MSRPISSLLLLPQSYIGYSSRIYTKPSRDEAFLLTSPSLRAAPPQDNAPPQTVNERSASVYAQGHPYATSIAATGPSGLSQAERTLWTSAHFARSPALLKRLGSKPQKDVWKTVNEAGGLPFRALPQKQHKKDWGRDRFGADLGDYPLEQFARRSERTLQLAALEVQHAAFLERRERERAGWVDPDTKEAVAVAPDEVEAERLRRQEIAALRMDLYGERTGAYGTDPVWDDVIPMPVEDGEGALAAIAYPEDYAEGNYLSICPFVTHALDIPNPAQPV